jgi:uncharacterized protein (UPF0371 family)
VFRNRLERSGVPVYLHPHTRGYPTDIDLVVSPEGYGRNDHIRVSKPLVVVTVRVPAAGSWPMPVPMYHDHRLGLDSGYAKFETFPVFNCP